MERLCLILFAVLFITPLGPGRSAAADAGRFLKVKAWRCSFEATLESEVRGKTGPGGMAYGPRRQFFQALGAAGVKAGNPGGDTDSYLERVTQSVKGSIRLHHVYDGGPDGIQIAGWNNGRAEVHARHYFEGTEQKETILRDKTSVYDGPASFEGDEYEPPFQIWIYPDQGTYALEYHLAPVRARQVEHCRMKEGMEAGRKKMEKTTDAEMPLGGFFSGLTRFTCATEKESEVEIDGGAMSGMVENVPLPSSGLVFEGEGESRFVDAKGVKMRWSCRPE